MIYVGKLGYGFLYKFKKISEVSIPNFVNGNSWITNFLSIWDQAGKWDDFSLTVYTLALTDQVTDSEQIVY